MNLNNLFRKKEIFLLFFILFFFASIAGVGALHSSLSEDKFIDSDEENDKGDDVAHIGENDGCKVTCIDPETWNEHTLRAYGASTIIDENGKNDKFTQSITLEYIDPFGNIYTYNDLGNEAENTETSDDIGVLFTFSKFYDGQSILSDHNMLVKHKKALIMFDINPLYLWELFFNSVLMIDNNENDVYATYSHGLDYSICEDTYIEYYSCVEAGGSNFCDNALFSQEFSDQTAAITCFAHQDGQIKAILSYDTEEDLGGAG